MSPAEVKRRVEDFVEAWAARFPSSRFSGRTVETARMSVGPQEVVELVASALKADLRGPIFEIDRCAAIGAAADAMTALPQGVSEEQLAGAAVGAALTYLDGLPNVTTFGGRT